MPIPLFTPSSALTQQNIPLAITIMVVGSFLFATGATIQHLQVGGAVDTTAENRQLSLRQIGSLIMNPRWVLGLAILITGSTAHIFALMLAPVTVVQPVGILAVPWSVLLASRIHKFTPTRQVWGAVAITVVSVVVFTVMAASTAANTIELPHNDIIVACVFVYLVGVLLAALGSQGPQRYRAIMWASAGSFYYGLSSALIKVITELIKREGFLVDPFFWTIFPFFVATYGVGGWMIQQAYANGPAEIVVGSMTTTDPMVAVGFGLIVLGEGVNITPVAAAIMLVAAVTAVRGVFILSKHHPEAGNYRRQGNEWDVDQALV